MGELRAFRHFETGGRAEERKELEAAWREELKLKDMFNSIEGNTARKGPPFSSRTPRTQSLPGSARGTGCGPDSIGAAASLALQIQTGGRTDGRADGRKNGRTGGRADGRSSGREGRRT